MNRYYLIFFILLLSLPVEASYTSKDCIRCHAKESQGSILQISLQEFQSSVHGSVISCKDCHAGILNKEHENLKGSGAVNCGQCHEQKNRHGSASKSENRPQCYSCHGTHGILGKDDKASMVHADQLEKTCKACHPLECGEAGYLSLLPSIQVMSHKKMNFSRNYYKENCIGCHQGQASHGEKEPVDSQNCYVCHMKMKNQIMGYIHARADLKKQPVIFTSAIIYHIAIVIILLGVFRYFFRASFSKSRNRGK